MKHVCNLLIFNWLMMNVVAEIRNLIVPVLEKYRVDLVELALRGKRNSQVLEIFLDGDAGVTTELCADVSREISRVIDQSDLVQGRYSLVVSSPGLHRPLKSLRQFRRNIGKKLEVLVESQNGTERVCGMLLQCNEQGIELQEEKKANRAIPYESILQAKVMLPW